MNKKFLRTLLVMTLVCGAPWTSTRVVALQCLCETWEGSIWRLVDASQRYHYLAWGDMGLEECEQVRDYDSRCE